MYLTLAFHQKLSGFPKFQMCLASFQRMTYRLIALTFITSLCLADISISNAEEPPISIGILATLTGDSAAAGANCGDGLDAARALYAPGDKVDNRKVRFIYADSKGQPAVAVSEFQRLASIEKVSAIVSQRSQSTMAISPLALSMGIPLMGIAGQSDLIRKNPHAFRSWPPAETEAKKLAELFPRWKVERVAMVSVEDEYTLSLRDSLREALRRYGKKLVFDVTILPSDNEYATIAAQIKQTNPDLIVCNLAIPQNGAFVKKLREMGIHTRIMGNFWISLPDFLNTTGREAAEDVAVAIVDDSAPWLRRAYTQAHINAAPSVLGYTCFVALAAILQAIERTPVPVDRHSLLETLLKTEQIQLPDQAIALRGREVIFPLLLKRYHGGVMVPF